MYTVCLSLFVLLGALFFIQATCFNVFFLVHAGGGLWGVISVPIFARDTGIIYAWSHASGLVSYAEVN